MRIAVHVDGELGVRTSRVLLAEPNVHVGLFDESSKAARIHRVNELDDWDVLVVDQLSPDARGRVEEALDLDIPVVLTGENTTFDVTSTTLVTGVLDGARLAIALADSQRQSTDELMEVQLGWTVVGHPLDEGVALTFPDPVGPLWADVSEVPEGPYPTKGLEAPHKARWRAVTARLTFGTGDGVHQQVFGFADDRKFLEGAALGAAALAAAEGAYPTGVTGPGEPGGVFMRNAERAGLHIAAFTPAQRRSG